MGQNRGVNSLSSQTEIFGPLTFHPGLRMKGPSEPGRRHPKDTNLNRRFFPLSPLPLLWG